MFANLLINLKLEPTRILSVVAALIALFVAFGLELTNEQTGAILALFSLLVGEGIRGKVSPAVPIDQLHEDEVA